MHNVLYVAENVEVVVKMCAVRTQVITVVTEKRKQMERNNISY